MTRYRCITAGDWPASLGVGRVYEGTPEGDRLRVTDEDGESYLYPTALFVPSWMAEGARVEAGSGEDHDTGRIVEVARDQVTVAWDTEIRTTQHWSALSEVVPMTRKDRSVRVEAHDLHGAGEEQCEVYEVEQRSYRDYWASVTDVPCPVAGCDQTVVWYEAGYVPGYRVCLAQRGDGYAPDTLRHRFLARGDIDRPVLVRDARSRVSISISDADMSAIDRRRGDSPLSKYLVAAALCKPGSLEGALDQVLVALEERHREDLAMAISVALGPEATR